MLYRVQSSDRAVAIHTGLKPAHHAKVPRARRLAAVVLLAQAYGTPDVSPTDTQVHRRRRHDADDHRIRVPFPMWPPDHVRIAAEAALPGFVTEDHGRVEARAILLFCKRAAHQRLHTQHIEVVGSDRNRENRILSAALPPHEGRHAGKRRITVAPLQVCGRRDQARIESPGGLGKHHKLVGSFERQIAQQDEVSHREYRGIDAHAKSRDRNDRRGKGALPEHGSKARKHIAPRNSISEGLIVAHAGWS